LKKVITYGTFDTLHFGHIRLLERAKNLGDYLIVAERKAFLEAIRYVDLVIPEHTWDQKVQDVITHDVDIFTMGDDWAGEFDFLSLIKANISNPASKSA